MAAPLHRALQPREQRLSIEETLHAYTVGSAHASHDEAEKGRLVPGQLADIAVFDRDLRTIDPEEILGAVCEMTLLGGKVVHEREAPA